MGAVADAPERILPWLLLAGWSGMRASDIAVMRREEIFVDEIGNHWVRVIGKGDVQRDVPIAAWVWATIEPLMFEDGWCWRRVRNPGRDIAPVTPQHVSQYCNAYLHGSGVRDTFHALRHRVATLAWHDTNDVRLLQDLLGHRDLGSLDVYTRVHSPAMARVVNNLPRPPILRLVASERTRQRGAGRLPRQRSPRESNEGA